MTKKHYYYYCFKPSLRVVAVRVLSVRPPTTTPPTILNHSPLTMIGRQIGATEKNR